MSIQNYGMQVLTNNSYRKLPCENASFLCTVLKFAHLQICELVFFLPTNEHIRFYF